MLSAWTLVLSLNYTNMHNIVARIVEFPEYSMYSQLYKFAFRPRRVPLWLWWRWRSDSLACTRVAGGVESLWRLHLSCLLDVMFPLDLIYPSMACMPWSCMRCWWWYCTPLEYNHFSYLFILLILILVFMIIDCVGCADYLLGTSYVAQMFNFFSLGKLDCHRGVSFMIIEIWKP